MKTVDWLMFGIALLALLSLGLESVDPIISFAVFAGVFLYFVITWLKGSSPSDEYHGSGVFYNEHQMPEGMQGGPAASGPPPGVPSGMPPNMQSMPQPGGASAPQSSSQQRRFDVNWQSALGVIVVILIVLYGMIQNGSLPLGWVLLALGLIAVLAWAIFGVFFWGTMESRRLPVRIFINNTFVDFTMTVFYQKAVSAPGILGYIYYNLPVFGAKSDSLEALDATLESHFLELGTLLTDQGIEYDVNPIHRALIDFANQLVHQPAFVRKCESFGLRVDDLKILDPHLSDEYLRARADAVASAHEGENIANKAATILDVFEKRRGVGLSTIAQVGVLWIASFWGGYADASQEDHVQRKDNLR